MFTRHTLVGNYGKVLGIVFRTGHGDRKWIDVKF